MKKYYELTNKSHQIYAAVILLNFTERITFFRAKWISELAGWQQVMETNYRDVWQQKYSHLTEKEDPTLK
jgi:hypothetical protein